MADYTLERQEFERRAVAYLQTGANKLFVRVYGNKTDFMPFNIDPHKGVTFSNDERLMGESVMKHNHSFTPIYEGDEITIKF